MKIKLYSLSLLTLGFVLTAPAQPGGPGMGMGGGGPNFSGSMSKLFGDNKTFSATLELLAKDGRAGDTTIPGKLAFDEGKSRFDMDMTKMKNSMMPPSAIEQMKAMGMDAMVVISRPDKKVNYMVYPGLKAFAEMATPEAESTESVNKYKVEKTEIGKETVDGHACVKNKVVVTDAKERTHESTVWSATDLKDFPVRIEMEERGTKLTMNFTEVKLTKPEATLFDAPEGMKKYDNVMSLMQAEMMKKMGGGLPPPQK